MEEHEYSTRRDFVERVERFRQAERSERVAALAMWRAKATSRGAWLAPIVSSAVAGMTTIIAIGFTLVVATANSSIGFSQYWLRHSDDLLQRGQRSDAAAAREVARRSLDYGSVAAADVYGHVTAVLAFCIVAIIIFAGFQAWQQGVAVAYRDAFEDVEKELGQAAGVQANSSTDAVMGKSGWPRRFLGRKKPAPLDPLE